MRNLSFTLILISFLNFSFSQDTVINLISRIDYLPNYSMWDGYQTMIMGYTVDMSTPIDLPSPTIIVNQGDSVEISMLNMSQPPAHTIHLHGLDVDQANDGVPHLSFIVSHGETKSYFFKAPHPGTYLYHCHVVSSIHVQGGMYGVLIVKPPNGENKTWSGGYSYDKEYSWLASEIDTNWHGILTLNHQYDSAQVEYEIPDFNPQYFLINGKSEQQLNDNSIKIQGSVNEIIYLRLSNIGFMGTRYIFPGELNLQVVSGDGRPLPSPINRDTLDVYPGERYGIILNPTTQFNDSVRIEYLNMNTNIVENTQYVKVDIEGFLENKNILETNNNYAIFPNPATKEVNIRFDNKSKEKSNYVIYDITGQVVYRGSTIKSEIKLKISNFQKGIYFLNLYNPNLMIKEKIIIN